MPSRPHAVFRSVFASILMSLILYLVNTCLTLLLDRFSMNLSIPFSSKRMESMTSYESQIAQHIINPETIEDRMDDIGGLVHVKQQIRSQVLLPLKHPKLFFSEKHKIRPPRGILLYGPPGTGKTMLARAIAAEAKVPFFSLTLASLENKWYGESSKLLAATFSLAHKMQPCVLFFDEIDGMIRTRSEADQSCVYAFKTEFLTHMDGIGKKADDAVIVIGCTNNQKSLDPAVSRRLPAQFEVELPSQQEIVRIFQLQLRHDDATVDERELTKLVNQMGPGRSGSDVVEIIRTAWASRLRNVVDSETFQRRVHEDGSTPEDLRRWVGNLRAHNIIEAIKDKGWYRQENESDDEEELPPEPPGC